MNDGQSFREGVNRGGAWRAEVGARVDELADRLDAVPTSGTFADRAATKATVVCELERAHEATGGKVSPAKWWTGSSMTRAWEAVHNAELALLKIETNGAVLAAVPRLLSWVQRAMDSGPTKEEHETALRTEMKKEEAGGPEPVPDRVKIRAAAADVTTANGRRYAAVRTFRNNLILVTIALVVALLTIATWHSINSSFLPLCQETKTEKEGTDAMAGEAETGDATRGAAGEGEATAPRCLTGSKPEPGDIWILLLVGAFGGLLGIAFGFVETEEASRFDPKTWQTFLKPVTGAATALAAVIFLQSGVVVELTVQGSAALIGYALLFGISQQLLTKMVDKKAASLVTPS